MFTPPPALATPRLDLRLPRLDDAEPIFADYAQDPEVSRYMTWRPHASIDETRAFLRVVVDAWRSGRGERSWAIERREDARLLGMIGVRDDHGVSVGYVLAREHWARGYMTEALGAVVAAAFADPDTWRVWAVCDVDNVASARVMEKAGMAFEGVLRRFSRHPNAGEAPRDCRCYAIVR